MNWLPLAPSGRRNGRLLTQCPACSGWDTVCIGDLAPYHQNMFGGVKSAISLDTGRLWRCSGCDFQFRHPYLEHNALTALYEELPTSVWKCEKPRALWLVVAAILEARAANRSILDVGCFCGDFLAWLPHTWTKLGIEPNAKASECARQRGIRILGSTANVMQRVSDVGAITLIDVLEHLRDPLLVLSTLASQLARGGIIVVATGSTDTAAWRWFRNHYWYCALPEHVSFVSLRWFRWAARRLGMRLVCHQYYSADPRRYKEWLLQWARLEVFRLVRRMIELGMPEKLLSLIPLVGRTTRWSAVPWWIAAKDHILVVLSR